MSRNESGELFDLSVPTLNNSFGEKHIFGTIKYGISFPLNKFIEELTMILKDGEGDDKSIKRERRLLFLEHCNSNEIIQHYFTIFTNYLNGGGSVVKWFNKQYHDQNIIFTVAGGNIITLFAQLLINMVDCFIDAVNSQYEELDYEAFNWDINSDEYEPRKFFKNAHRDFMFI